MEVFKTPPGKEQKHMEEYSNEFESEQIFGYGFVQESNSMIGPQDLTLCCTCCSCGGGGSTQMVKEK